MIHFLIECLDYLLKLGELPRAGSSNETTLYVHSHEILIQEKGSKTSSPNFDTPTRKEHSYMLCK